MCCNVAYCVSHNSSNLAFTNGCKPDLLLGRAIATNAKAELIDGDRLVADSVVG